MCGHRCTVPGEPFERLVPGVHRPRKPHGPVAIPAMHSYSPELFSEVCDEEIHMGGNRRQARMVRRHPQAFASVSR